MGTFAKSFSGHGPSQLHAYRWFPLPAASTVKHARRRDGSRSRNARLVPLPTIHHGCDSFEIDCLTLNRRDACFPSTRLSDGAASAVVTSDRLLRRNSSHIDSHESLKGEQRSLIQLACLLRARPNREVKCSIFAIKLKIMLMPLDSWQMHGAKSRRFRTLRFKAFLLEKNRSFGKVDVYFWRFAA